VLGAEILPVPLVDLTDADLAAAAQVCRAMAHQEAERAKKLGNPTTRGPIENASARYRVLAEKFEGEGASKKA
jgi:hypothetical protein